MEYGIFSDEGLIEGDFISEAEALSVISERYSPDDDLHVGRICPEHSESEADYCELCSGE